MNKLRDINAYILQNPDALQSLFVEIFGKYLMRYYDATGQYAVSFDTHASTSYMNSSSKQIVIALKNIIMLLQANVHVLSVAYHELAHVLYTSDRARDQMRRKAGDILLANGTVADRRVYHHNNVEQQLHGIWNLVEDQRIERLMVLEFPFLKDIVEPLKSVLGEDDKLFSWRRDNYSTRRAFIPAQLITLCESYAGLKKFKSPTIAVGAQILADIYALVFGKQVSATQPKTIDYENVKYQPVQGQDDEPQQQGQPMPDDQHGDDPEDSDDQGQLADDQTIDDNDDQDDDAEQQDDEENGADGVEVDGDVDEGEEDDSDIDELDDEDADDSDEELEDGNPAISQQELDKRDKELAKAQAQDDNEKGILRMLKDIQRTMRENAELQDYKNSVIEDHKPFYKGSIPEHRRIPAIFSIAQDVRNGMTAAQRKTYNSEVSNRVSVSRVVEALASKQEPRVFSNKGKDMTQLRKVVIFEDVSGSTHGVLSEMFSTTAYALAKSFTTSEWWLYGSQLVQKHLVDYPAYSAQVSQEYGNNDGTSSQRLLNVMKKYANEKAIYVVITDGDLHPLIDHELFKKFNDSTAIIGVLDDKIKKVSKHAFDFRKDYEKLDTTRRTLIETYVKSIPQNLDWPEQHAMVSEYVRHNVDPVLERERLRIINKGLQEVVAVVKSGLK